MSVKVHEPVCLDSAQDRFFWFDHFLGDQVKDEWQVSAVGAGTGDVVDQQAGGIVRSTTGALNGNTVNIVWHTGATPIRIFHVDKKATFEIRLKANHNTNVTIYTGLWYDSTNFITFRYAKAGVAGNWEIWCYDDGAGASQDSGVAADTSYHMFRFECHTHGSNHVHFYIDNVETGNSPVTTNIPDDATDFFYPRIYIATAEDSAKSMDADYVVVRQDR